jgi:hypothetical protein
MKLDLASTNLAPSSATTAPKVISKVEKIHIVVQGDTLSAIAKQEGVPLKDIIDANPQLSDPDKIFVDDRVKIPDLSTIATDSPLELEDEPVEQIPQTPPSPPVTPQNPLSIATDEAVNRVVKAEKVYYDTSASTQGQGAAVPYFAKNLASAKDNLVKAVTAEMNIGVKSGASPDELAAAQKIQQRYAAGSPESNAVSVAANEATAQSQANAIVAQAKTQSDPQKAVQALNDSYVKATPAVQKKVLEHKDAQAIIQRLADYANQPLSNKQSESVGEQVPGRLAMQNLNKVTSTLDKNIAAQVVAQAVPKFEAYTLQYQNTLGNSPLGPDGIGYMLQVLTRVEGTAAGNAATQRLAKLGIWNEGGLTMAVAQGASPAYIVELAKQPGMDSQRVMNTAFSGMAMLRSQTNDHALAYGEHMQEIAWLVANHGAAMTPDQLDKAIADYSKDKGADWQAKAESFKKTLVQDGTKLLQQMLVMQNLPPELASSKDQANKAIADTLSDPKANFAISTALQQNPALTTGKQGESLLGFLKDVGYIATPKIADQVRKLTNEAITAYVKSTVIKQIGDFNPNDPASVQRAQAAVEKLRTSTFARVMGLSDSDLDKTITALKSSIPAAGESAEKIAERNAALDKTLQGIKGLDKSTLPGQLVRGLGLALAGVGFLNSVDKATSDPSLKNSLKVIVDSAGLGQKGIELLTGLGKVDKDTALGKLGGSAASKFLGVLSAVFDIWNAGEAAVKGDIPSAILYTTTAGGGLLAAFGTGSLAGPIGIGIVLVSVIGLSIWNGVKEANMHEPGSDNGVSMRFLQHAGLNELTARALVDQSGDGYSPVPMLERYAQLQGLDLANPVQRQKFVDWVNSIPVDKLATLRNTLHMTLDNLDGDVSKFTATNSNDAKLVPMIERPENSFAAYSGYDLRSAAQLSAVIKVLGIAPLKP